MATGTFNAIDEAFFDAGEQLGHEPPDDLSDLRSPPRAARPPSTHALIAMGIAAALVLAVVLAAAI